MYIYIFNSPVRLFFFRCFLASVQKEKTHAKGETLAISKQKQKHKNKK